MARYDAFISYSHAKDKPIAAALQSVVQRLGKPWYQRRALRVFRDDTSLAATPQLWPSIEQALGQSRFFILLASPEAAASKWVNQEISRWLDHNGVETLLIGLTDGELAWDESAGDFGWRVRTPLPPVLTGRFPAEPKWVDLRSYRAGADKRDAKFTELAADFAAAIRGMPKEDLLSQEVRQQRRALALAWSAAGSLLVLAGLAAWQWKVAIDNERLATQQKEIATTEGARAERNFAAAKSTIDSVIFDLAQSLEDVEGMRVDTVRRILGQAEAAVGKLASRIEGDPSVQHSQGAMFGLFSETYVRVGATETAAEYAQKAVDLFRVLVSRDPADAEVRNELSHSLYQLGRVREVQGDFPKALAAYRESLEVMRELAGKEPASTRWRRSIAVVSASVGETLMKLGQLDEALVALHESRDIIRGFAATQPDDKRQQRDWSVIQFKLADALNKHGDVDEALAAYREFLEITRALVTKDPDDTQWRRDIATCQERIGDILRRRGDPVQALAAYRESVDIIRALAKKDPSNATWQEDLSMYLNKAGMALEAQADLAGALAAYRESLSIRQHLSASDRNNTEWQTDLRISVSRIGGLAFKLVLARDFGQALAVAEEAITAAPDTIWLIKNKAHALMFLGREDDARALYLRYRGENKVQGDKSWDTVVLEDFAELRKVGLTNALMWEIEKQLALGG
jgi:tetratricopeptide (TPR) repeat protein